MSLRERDLGPDPHPLRPGIGEGCQRDGWESGPRSSEESRNHLLRGVDIARFDARVVVIPGLGVPNFGAVASADHCKVAAKTRILAQMYRDGHSALTIGILL